MSALPLPKLLDVQIKLGTIDLHLGKSVIKGVCGLMMTSKSKIIFQILHFLRDNYGFLLQQKPPSEKTSRYFTFLASNITS